MQSPNEQLKEMIREWIELELDETCVAGDSYTRLAVKKKDNVITFSSRSRGHTKEYLTATLTGDEIELSSTQGEVRQWISTAQFCIGKTLQNY
ncbi:hypothetical protein [Pseudomonas phage vB_PaeM_PS119XW]|uniref:Uncharacterized protein n=1 Tax=Pseudomonas phage vB_PaeM_PS119XW TaxID=2601632 RepID=A0A5C1K7C2_9CAUD|nr:hypothetical protein PP933_gp033 [Pseudomonas phage vB_PaeM_PS119XW]QEM41762.1 hypothetical protein [Pseudomonas phage vB_PaeM_PS119XW]